MFFAYALFFTLIIGCSSAEDFDGKISLTQTKINIPIIMLHGALASGDTYAKTSMLFTSNDYPKEMLYAFDWNSLSGGASASTIADLDKLVDQALTDNNATHVFLIGHSAGGGLGYSYCNDAGRAKKIMKYVHLASNPQTKQAGPTGEISTLNIYSSADKVVAGSDIPNATNVKFDDLDHYEVATSEKTFEKIYEFFMITKPLQNKITIESKPVISGKILTLGENKVPQNATLNIYPLNPVNAERIGGPIISKAISSDGIFGPLTVENDTHYEFEVSSTDPDFRTVHYYRQPFIHNNQLVYLRVFPPSNSFAGLLLGNLPKNDDQAVMAVFSANKAMIHQRDSVKIQNINLITATQASPQNSTIAMFLYDNGDNKTSGSGHPAFAVLPFLKGSDVFINTLCSEGIPVTYNGTTLVASNYKSKSEGVSILVFE